MIYSYKFRNLYSFSDDTLVNFEVPESEKDSHLVATPGFGNQVNKVMLIVGNNASGKTGLLKPLMFLNWFILDSFSSKPDDIIFFEPHFFHTDSPSYIEVTFDSDGDVFTYSVELTREAILNEELRVRNIGEKRVTTRRVFKRTWNGENYEIVQRPGLGFPMSQAAKKRTNASYLSIAFQEQTSSAISLIANMACMGNVGPYGNIDYDYFKEMDEVSSYFLANKDVFNDAKEFLKDLDLGIEDICIKERKLSSGEVENMAWVTHGAGEKKAELPIFKESTGTQGLFRFLHKILPALAFGGVVLLDEIESDLHPHLSERLVDLFLHEETNPNNAQLVLATHDVTLFNMVGKHQLVLVEKDDSLSSYCYRLDEVQGVRKTDNLMTKYLGGNYGAIPRS